MSVAKFEGLLHAPYDKSMGPTSVGHLSEAMNCQLLVHRFFANRGLILPPSVRSKEIFEDSGLFHSVEGATQEGDVYLFGKKEETDSRNLHLAVHTGDIAENGDPLLIHANYIDGKSSIWPLSKFSGYPRYEKLYGVKRPNQALSPVRPL